MFDENKKILKIDGNDSIGTNDEESSRGFDLDDDGHIPMLEELMASGKGKDKKISSLSDVAIVNLSGIPLEEIDDIEEDYELRPIGMNKKKKPIFFESLDDIRPPLLDRYEDIFEDSNSTQEDVLDEGDSIQKDIFEDTDNIHVDFYDDTNEKEIESSVDPIKVASLYESVDKYEKNDLKDKSKKDLSDDLYEKKNQTLERIASALERIAD